jgi:plasmid replication initiation protein
MKKNLIYKSNNLIEAAYELTVSEQRVLLSCISQINPEQPLHAGDCFTVTVEQARDLFYSGQHNDQAYSDLKNACGRLFRREIKLFSDNGDKELLTHFVSYIEFNNKTQSVEICFAKPLIPYLVSLQGNFTKYRLEYISKLSSKYAIRIYELIVRWAMADSKYERKHEEIEVEDFRDLLQLGNKYKQIGQLKDRVLQPALEQINKETDFNLKIGYRKIKRTIKFIQFEFERKPEARAS